MSANTPIKSVSIAAGSAQQTSDTFALGGASMALQNTGPGTVTLQATNMPNSSGSWVDVVTLAGPGTVKFSESLAFGRLVTDATAGEVSAVLSHSQVVPSGGGGGGGGGAVTVADGADVAIGAKANAAYADETGAASGSVVALLKGSFVKLAAIFTRQAETRPFTPGIGVEPAATVDAGASAAAAPIPAGASQVLLVAETATVGVAFLSSNTTTGMVFSKCLRVPTGDAGVTFGVPAGATHIGHMTASGAAKLTISGGVGS